MKFLPGKVGKLMRNSQEFSKKCLDHGGHYILIRKDNFHSAKDYNLIKKFIKESV